jgi:hypothetical protein
MADEATATPAAPARSPALDDVKKEYIALLMSILETHAKTNKQAQEALAEIKANPQKALNNNLLEIIKILCECPAILKILDCLCDALT